MRKSLHKKFFLLVLFCISFFTANAQKKKKDFGNCNQFQVVKKLSESDPEWDRERRKQERELEKFTQDFIEKRKRDARFARKGDDELMVIPVVFHIVHNGRESNITEEQVLSGMRLINEDFQGRNPQFNNITDGFDAIKATMNIEFRLAKRDPDGNPTNGIVRWHENEYALDGGKYQDEIKKMSQWPRSKYMNVWVVQSSDGSNGSAYAHYPSSTVGEGEYLDGILSSYWAIGDKGNFQASHVHTFAHEIGHYLNLKHTWGDDTENGQATVEINGQNVSACIYDDGVEDTPTTLGAQGNCNSVSCGTRDNTNNFMSYSGCTRMFTLGQKERMLAALHSPVGERNNLWTDANLIATGVVDGNLYADLSAPETFTLPGGELKFEEKSGVFNGAIVSWEWTFEGGFPSTYVGKNPPPVRYDVPGLYDVKVKVTDSQGATSETVKTEYIEVKNEWVMGSARSYTVCDAQFVDNGRSVYYTNDQNHLMTFYPEQAGKTIELDFIEFGIEADANCGFDYMKIYDGEDKNAPLIGTYCGTNSPGTVKATNAKGAVTVWFFADAGVDAPGWRADVSCQDFDTAPQVYFDADSRNLSSGQTRNFTDRSNVAPTTSISSWEWTFEGGTPASSTDQNPSVTYTSNGIYDVTLRITTADGAVATETYSDYIEVNSDYVMDNKMVTVSDGYFYDTGYKSDYEKNEFKTMTFLPYGDKKQLRVEFEEFALEVSDDCDNDYLRVYDGKSIYDPQIGQFCGNSIPADIGNIFTASNPDGALTFSFRTDDETTNFAGFKAKISTVDAPDFLVSFQADENNVPVGSSVNFSENSVSFIQDEISSWEWTFEGGVPASFIGKTPPAVKYTSSGDFDVTLKVSSTTGKTNTVTKSDFISVNSDFNIASGVVTVCDAKFYDAGGKTGETGLNKELIMTFYPETDGQSLSFDFTSFAVEAGDAGPSNPCNYDFLEIYDGENVQSGLVGRFCGDSSPGTVVATNPKGALTFYFHGDTNTEADGWEANITCVAPPVVPTPFFSADFTEIKDGGYVNFTHSIEANKVSSITAWEWTFTGGTPATFNGETPPAISYNATGEYDVSLKVTTADGSNTKTYTKLVKVKDVFKLIGQNGHQDIRTCGGTFTDHDLDGTGNGELGEYSSYANQTITFYPQELGKNVQLSFTSLDIFSTPNCFADYIEIHNGKSTNAAVLARICGSTLPSDITADNAEGVLTVHFVSNQDGFEYNGQGWEADLSCVDKPSLAPVAEFVSDLRNVDVGQDVIFTDNSTNEATAWLWTFTGKTTFTSSEQNPRVQFPRDGNYSVSLKATNAHGENTIVKNDFIIVSKEAPTSYIPQANILGEREYVISKNESLTFTDDTDGVADNIEWNVYAGESASGTSLASGTASTFDYSFSTNGVFTVALSASNSEGGTTDSVKVSVYESLPNLPVASIEGETSRLVHKGTSLSFVDASTGTVDSKTWALYAGASASGVAIASGTDAGFSYAFATSGTYTLELTLTNLRGSSSATTTINTYEVTAGINSVVNTSCTSASVSYSASVSQGVDTFLWTFVGGTPSSSTERNPTVTYASDGLYSAVLNVSRTGVSETADASEVVNINTSGDHVSTVSSFEEASALANWTIDNPDNSFTWELNNTGGYQSSTSLVMNNADNRVTGEVDKITSSNLDFTNVIDEISFYVAYTQFDANSPDVLALELSKDCGQTWTKVYEKTHTDLETKNVNGTTESNNWIPSVDSDWRKEVIDASAFAGESKVQLRFINTSGFGTRIWIDNIEFNQTAAQTPVADFNSNPSAVAGEINITEGESVTFADVSTNTPTSWSWKVASLEEGTNADFTHTFANVGTFTVELSATNSAGSSSKSVTVNVSGLLTASITPDSSLDNLKVLESRIFTANSNIVGSTYSWEVLKDGNVSPVHTGTGETLSYQFATAGNYEVKLTTSNASQTASASETFSVTKLENPATLKAIPELLVNATHQLEFENLPAGVTVFYYAEPLPKPNVYATVSSEGVLSALKATQIPTANQIAVKLESNEVYNQKILYAKFSIKLKPQTLTLSTETINLKVGESFDISTIVSGNETALVLDNKPAFLSLDNLQITADSKGSGTITVRAIADDVYASSEKTITVNVAPVEYEITVNQVANGSISPETLSVVEGTDQEFTFTPALDHELKSILVDGDSVANTSPYTLSDIQKAQTVSAVFRKTVVAPVEYEITVNQVANGTISPVTLNVVEAADQEFTFDAMDDYELHSVLVDGDSVSNTSPYILSNIQKAQTVSAVFRKTVVAPVEYEITVNQVANGTISPATLNVVEAADQEFTFDAMDDYELHSVLVDGDSVSNTSPYTLSDIQKAQTVSAVFRKTVVAPVEYKITVNQVANGTISPATLNVVEAADQEFTFDAMDDYELHSVLVDGDSVSNTSPYTLSDIQKAQTVSAVFRKTVVAPVEYKITVNQVANGTISPATLNVVEAADQEFTFDAMDDYELHSVLVDGDSVSNTSPYTLSDIQKAQTVSAVFRKTVVAPVEYKITVNQVANGTISPATLNVVEAADQEFTFDAMDDYELHSVLVDGDSVSNTSPYILSNIQKAQTVSAVFRKTVVAPVVDFTLKKVEKIAFGLDETYTFEAATYSEGAIISWSVSRDGVDLNLGSKRGVTFTHTFNSEGTYVVHAKASLLTNVQHAQSPELTVTNLVDQTLSIVSVPDLEIGTTTNLQITGAMTTLTYVSSDESIATVDANGLITAIAEGNATITVNAEASAEYKEASGTVDITVNRNVLAFDTDLDFVLNAYPNPSTGSFKLNLPKSFKKGSVDVITALGTVFRNFEIKDGNQTFNLQGLNAGIYYLKVTIDGRSSVLKLTLK